MLKRVFAFLFMTLTSLAIWIGASGWTINGTQPGSTGAMTPISVGTSTPVVVIPCSTTLNAGAVNPATAYLNFCVTGGTSGTDGCYFAAAAPSPSPCASPSPAPNAGTKAGMFVGTGGSGWGCFPINWPSAGGGSILSSEWSAVCTAASMSVGFESLP